MDKLKLMLVGSNITHSLSPFIHKKAMSLMGVDVEYEKVNIQKGGLEDFIKAIKNEGVRGVNATMPHKRDIIEYLDYVDDYALYCGSVNTILVKNNALYGYTTDANGFLHSLILSGTNISGKNVLILGTGGVVYNLLPLFIENLAASIYVLGRSSQSIQAIEKYIKNNHLDVKLGSIRDINIYAGGADILINATPLGMKGFEDDFEDFEFISKMRSNSLVCDLNYMPQKTNLLKEASIRGHKTLNGLGMLIFQALLADEIFLGKKLPLDFLYSSIAEALNQY